MNEISISHQARLTRYWFTTNQNESEWLATKEQIDKEAGRVSRGHRWIGNRMLGA